MPELESSMLGLDFSMLGLKLLKPKIGSQNQSFETLKLSLNHTSTFATDGSLITSRINAVIGSLRRILQSLRLETAHLIMGIL